MKAPRSVRDWRVLLPAALFLATLFLMAPPVTHPVSANVTALVVTDTSLDSGQPTTFSVDAEAADGNIVVSLSGLLAGTTASLELTSCGGCPDQGDVDNTGPAYSLTIDTSGAGTFTGMGFELTLVCPDDDVVTLRAEQDLVFLSQNISCTAVAAAGDIVITKAVVGTDASFDFDFVAAGGGACDGAPDITPADFDLMDGQSETLTCVFGTYTITENVTAGYTITDIDCGTSTASFTFLPSAGLAFSDGDIAVEIVLNDAADGALCVFENSEGGTIVIAKEVLGADDTFTFDLLETVGSCTGDPDATPASFDLADGDEETLSCENPGTYEITETVTPGYTLVDIDCSGSTADVTFEPSGDTAFNPGDETVEVVFDDPSDTATCTFLNLDDDLGNIVIIKDALGSISDDFEFEISGNPSCDDTFTLTGDLDFEEFDCDPDETYVVEEVDLPAGWSFVDITCQVFGDADFEVDADSDPDTNDVEIILTDNPLDLVICAFENVESGAGAGNLKIVKEFEDDDDESEDFDFDVSGDCDDDGSFTLTDDGDSETLTCDFEDGDEITIEEDDLPDDWSLEDIDCDVDGDDADIDFDYDINGESGGSVTISIDGDVDSDVRITCTFTNDFDEGIGSISPITNVGKAVKIYPSQPTLDCARSELINITVIDARGLPVLDGTRILTTASVGTVTPMEAFTLASAATVHYVAPSTGNGGTATITAAVAGATGTATIKLNSCAAAAPAAPAATVRPPSTGGGLTITPPSTGDAGLAAARDASAKWNAVLVLGLAGLTSGLAAAAVALTRRNS